MAKESQCAHAAVSGLALSLQVQSTLSLPVAATVALLPTFTRAHAADRKVRHLPDECPHLFAPFLVHVGQNLSRHHVRIVGHSERCLAASQLDISEAHAPVSVVHVNLRRPQ